MLLIISNHFLPMKIFDCIVVGNGSIGLAIAYELSKNASKEFNIAIFGKNSREGSASLAAGAMISVFGEIEYDSLSSKQDETRFKMLLKSKDLWNKHILNLKEETKTSLEIKKGTVILNNSSSDELDDENFKSIENALKKFKEKYYFINNKDLKGYNPHPKARSLKSLYIPNENSINSAKELLNAYDQVFKQKNNYNFPNIFKPERKIISTMTIHQAIEKSVKHRLSAAFQHELQIPSTETVEIYKENLRTQIKNIYKTAKLKRGVPPELLNMYLYKKIRNK